MVRISTMQANWFRCAGAVGTSLEQALCDHSYTPNGKQEYVVDANGNKARLTHDGPDRCLRQFPSTSVPSGFQWPDRSNSTGNRFFGANTKASFVSRCLRLRSQMANRTSLCGSVTGTLHLWP